MSAKVIPLSACPKIESVIGASIETGFRMRSRLLVDGAGSVPVRGDEAKGNVAPSSSRFVSIDPSPSLRYRADSCIIVGVYKPVVD